LTSGAHLTRAWIHLDRLTRNLTLLAEEAGGRPLWPVLKANAYGHGAELVAAHLVGLGHETLCVAHVGEALSLRQAGIDARFVLLSPSLPEHSEAVVAHGFEPVVTTLDAAESLAREAQRAGRPVDVHVKVDTGMGRVGVAAHQAAAFVTRCRTLEGLRVRGLMSHFPRADEKDKSFSLQQIATFEGLLASMGGRDGMLAHMANSAAVLDLPTARFDACRPGIALYGLAPSREIANPRVRALEPVLEWKTRITFLKEVPTGTGLSYGHSYTTERPSLVATLPVGYGDGLSRGLSDRLQVLVGGRRCPQRGRITMDQTLVDVTDLRGRVALGDEAVLIGRQGEAEVGADELAGLLGTIHYEVVTSIAARVARVPVRERS
jgi:alanine racemase